jgi:DNA-binding transcriptional regulator YiaG
VYLCLINEKTMTHLELKQARQHLGLTQKEFANLVFRTIDCVAKWESGKYPIPKHINHLIKSLHLDR